MLAPTKLQNHTKAQKYKKIQFLFAITLLILIDQISKYIIRFRQPTEGGFYICNPGVAFGLHLPSWLILTTELAFISFAGFFIFNFQFLNLKLKISNYFPLIFVLSGAISNTIDRLHFGCVVDFINLKIWPLFNLADIFICTGIFMLILKNVKCKYQNEK